MLAAGDEPGALLAKSTRGGTEVADFERACIGTFRRVEAGTLLVIREEVEQFAAGLLA